MRGPLKVLKEQFAQQEAKLFRLLFRMGLNSF